jgi:hypothetical protein
MPSVRRFDSGVTSRLRRRAGDPDSETQALQLSRQGLLCPETASFRLEYHVYGLGITAANREFSGAG